MLCKTASEMVHQWNIVNAAFSDRIREYIKARTDLETHLAKVGTRNQLFVECPLLLIIITMMVHMIGIIKSFPSHRNQWVARPYQPTYAANSLVQ